MTHSVLPAIREWRMFYKQLDSPEAFRKRLRSFIAFAKRRIPACILEAYCPEHFDAYAYKFLENPRGAFDVCGVDSNDYVISCEEGREITPFIYSLTNTHNDLETARLILNEYPLWCNRGLLLKRSLSLALIFEDLPLLPSERKMKNSYVVIKPKKRKITLIKKKKRTNLPPSLIKAQLPLSK